jgi:transketolase
MAVLMKQTELVAQLRNKATRFRIDSIRATSEAGSGHPTSCASAAEIVAALFFAVMRYDPRNPRHPGNDRFILSKGHAAPLLYAAWAQAGSVERDELLKLRTLESNLEGHPTPRLPFVDIATGSLGQGLSAGAGMAWNAKYLDRTEVRVYVLLGDAETAEGAVWEAIELARHKGLDNLCAIVDVNRLGQSDPTMHQHDMDAHRARWSAFGWHAIVLDGHDLGELLAAFDEAARTTGQPTVILAHTLKGKGIAAVEDLPGKHGKPLNHEDAQMAIETLMSQIVPDIHEPAVRSPNLFQMETLPIQPMPPPAYKQGDTMATRAAFGDAMVALGYVNPLVVALDGDVKDSTHMEKFAKEYPRRFVECYIAEQNMIGAAVGLAACGKIPFAATFACFLTRAHDFIRMAAISKANIKLVGSHAGVSIGQDGPSQMGLEDIAMMTAQPDTVVLYPADAVSTHWCVDAAAQHRGMVYIRTTRGKTPVHYDNQERFPIGGCKVLRRSESDQLTIVAAGITLFEALKAYEDLKAARISARVIDLYSVRPIDQATLLKNARATGGRIFTVEDHYEHGGLGDAVLGAVCHERIRVHKLAVREIPHSGKPDELLDRYGINARAITETVKRLLHDRV